MINIEATALEQWKNVVLVVCANAITKGVSSRETGLKLALECHDYVNNVRMNVDLKDFMVKRENALQPHMVIGPIVKDTALHRSLMVLFPQPDKLATEKHLALWNAAQNLEAVLRNDWGPLYKAADKLTRSGVHDV
jgi:hypothetical protein